MFTIFSRGKHSVERTERKMVGGAQVFGVRGRQRVRQQVRRATGGLGRAVYAQRPGFDLARHAVGPQEKTAKSHRRTRKKTRGPDGQQIQTRMNLNGCLLLFEKHILYGSRCAAST